MSNLQTKQLSLAGLILIEPKVFTDERGFFLESWNQSKYQAAGITSNFVQDNLSFSQKGVLRGLHYQLPKAQGKLLQVLQGEIFDVAVDIRKSSQTFGKWEGVHLSSENKKQLFIPEGFAHGFLVLSETALVSYKCTELYHPENEKTIVWNDPTLNIAWPFEGEKIISAKDQKGLKLADMPKEILPD